MTHWTELDAMPAEPTDNDADEAGVIIEIPDEIVALDRSGLKAAYLERFGQESWDCWGRFLADHQLRETVAEALTSLTVP